MACLLDGTPLRIEETASGEYHVAMPRKDPGEPFVIRLKISRSGSTKRQYREALT